MAPGSSVISGRMTPASMASHARNLVDEDREAFLAVAGDLTPGVRKTMQELGPDLNGAALADEPDHPRPVDGLARHDEASRRDLDERAIHIGDGAPVTSLCTLVIAAAISALYCKLAPPVGTVN
jgi:hypothetical protein